MENELKINQEKCYVDKRKLVLNFDLEGKNYEFFVDHWCLGNDGVEYLKVNGKDRKFKIIQAYKHCIQAYFDTDEEFSDRKVFIDRRYEHNYSFDVYYGGKHYLVGEEIYK